MTRRHVRAALARGIEAGDDEVARASLAKIDPALRKAARRRLERALVDATLATTEVGSNDPETQRHIMRVAALTQARVAVDATDRAAVATAYAAQKPLAMPRLPVATIALAMLAVLVTAGTYLYIDAMPGRASRAYARPLPPPAKGAYRDGGVPLRDAAVHELLVGDFTKYVLAADRDRRNGGSRDFRAPFAAAVKAAAPIKAYGPIVAKEWDQMIAALDRTVELDETTKEWKAAADELRAEVREVSDQLGSVGLGYYLEGTWRQGASAWALVYTYLVEEVVLLDVGKETRRVLSLRRLDNINITKTLLGMQSEELGDPVLLLDQIDEHVASKVMPALAEGGLYPLADETFQRAEEGKALALAAGEAVRAEAKRVLGDADFAAASRVAALLARRAEIIERWRDKMERKQWTFSRTDELFLPPNLLASLEGHVPDRERERVAEIEEEIASAGGPRIASRVHELVAATVRRHEAQHGLDDDRDAPLRYPAALEDNIGPLLDDDGEPRRRAESAHAELSAYTSQLANDPRTPLLTLWFVARHAFMRTSWGSVESYAAVIIVEGVARHLGLPSPGPVIHDREIDRARLGQLMLAVSAVPADQLRTATRALWKELYGEELVPIVDRPRP